MTHVSDERVNGDEKATESGLPTKYLPEVEFRDLPDPPSFRKVLGASVIILATGLGSGPFILWPYLTSQIGLGLAWLGVVGLVISMLILLEVERYTLATGETVVTGFTRLWKPWGVIFILATVSLNLWPGWATGASSLITFLFGFSSSTITPLTIAFLIAIGVALTLSPVVYKTVEKLELALVCFIVIFLLIAVVVATNGASWAGTITQAPSGLANLPQYAGEIGIAALVGAIAFVGAGGPNVLVQSNYVRDKGMGMGQLIPRVVSPITGADEASPSLGYIFPQTEENMRRWRGWWKLANREQFCLYFVLGTLSFIALCVLTFSTIGITEQVGTDLAFVQAQAQALRDVVAPWFGIFFLIAGIAVLLSTNVGILDFTGRLVADSLKVSFLAESRFWTESKLYVAVVWGLIVFGSIVLLAGFNQPIVLLVITSAGYGVSMVFISGLLIQLNRQALPNVIRLKGSRLIAMIGALLFYGVLLVFLFLSFLP